LELPSRCQFDSPNDAFPEVGICGEKAKPLARDAAERFAILNPAVDRRLHAMSANTL